MKSADGPTSRPGSSLDLAGYYMAFSSVVAMSTGLAFVVAPKMMMALTDSTAKSIPRIVTNMIGLGYIAWGVGKLAAVISGADAVRNLCRLFCISLTFHFLASFSIGDWKNMLFVVIEFPVYAYFGFVYSSKFSAKVMEIKKNR
mmetsp:Transcript_26256/g.63272  ORF Transcript_26256/g.63272 Transcript_26256/m.63272 type:complete len:144 (+) Transcript_26256:260-691(+)